MNLCVIALMCLYTVALSRVAMNYSRYYNEKLGQNHQKHILQAK